MWFGVATCLLAWDLESKSWLRSCTASTPRLPPRFSFTQLGHLLCVSKTLTSGSFSSSSSRSSIQLICTGILERLSPHALADVRSLLQLATRGGTIMAKKLNNGQIVDIIDSEFAQHGRSLLRAPCSMRMSWHVVAAIGSPFAQLVSHALTPRPSTRVSLAMLDVPGGQPRCSSARLVNVKMMLCLWSAPLVG